MGAYKYIIKNERNVYRDKNRKKELLISLSDSPIIERIKRPTRLAKAKSLGYSTKKGIIVVRVRVGKGLFRRERPVHARRPSKTGLYFGYKKDKLKIAAERALKRYKNMEFLGGYPLVDNGKYKWFELILRQKLKN